MTTAISIIVPVYNVAGYLNSCLDSILTQSLREIEVIAVNDASTDTSAALLEEYARSDHRVTIIQLEKRQGVSVARNTGLDQAKGDYVIFLDGDDFWPNPKTLEDLLKQSVDHRLDILEFGLYQSNNAAESPPSTSGQMRVVQLDQQPDRVINYNIPTKLIAKSVIDRGKVRFEPQLIVGEDALFSVALYCFAKKLGVYDKVYYFYRARPNSVSSRDWDAQKLFCTALWFERAIPFVQKNLPIVTHKPVLTNIAQERFHKLQHRLGAVALRLLSPDELDNYLAIWSRCLQMMSSTFDGSITALQSNTGLPTDLLSALAESDRDAFRAHFATSLHQKSKAHQPGKITLTKDQGIAVAQAITQSLSAGAIGSRIRQSVRCEFGNGVFVTLPHTKARQLAAQLMENRQPTITLRFEL